MGWAKDILEGELDKIKKLAARGAQQHGKYTRQIYAHKCETVYEHVFESHFDNGYTVYDRAA